MIKQIEDPGDVDDVAITDNSDETSTPSSEEGGESELVRSADVLPPLLHLLPLPERPLFPAQVLPIWIPEEPWLDTVKAVGETPHKMLSLVLVRGESAAEAKPADFYPMSTVVRMHNPSRQEGRIQFIAEGIQRLRIGDWISRVPPYLAAVSYPKSPEEDPDQVRAYGTAIVNTIKELLPLNPLYGEQLQMFLAQVRPSKPEPFADFAANLTTAPKEELQEVLETIPVVPRTEKVLVLLNKELDIARLQAEIRKGMEERMSEQLKEIQKELGIAKDDRAAESDRFKERLETLAPSEEAQKRIDEEMDKMPVLEIGSPEYAVTRNYLDWLTVLPGVGFRKTSWISRKPAPCWIATTKDSMM
jgi:ATP-dependent Lon protease